SLWMFASTAHVSELGKAGGSKRSAVTIPRTEVTKRLWAYIKKNKLQDPKNKRMIKADGALKDVFGGKSTVSMFEMTKLVSKHLLLTSISDWNRSSSDQSAGWPLPQLVL